MPQVASVTVCTLWDCKEYRNLATCKAFIFEMIWCVRVCRCVCGWCIWEHGPLFCWTYHYLDLDVKTRGSLKFCVCASLAMRWGVRGFVVAFETVCVCAKAHTTVSACVTVDVLSKGLRRFVRGSLIRRSMTCWLLTAFEMGGRAGWPLMRLQIWPTHSQARTQTAPFKCDTSRLPKSSERVLNNADMCVPTPVCVIVLFLFFSEFPHKIRN